LIFLYCPLCNWKIEKSRVFYWVWPACEFDLTFVHCVDPFHEVKSKREKKKEVENVDTCLIDFPKCWIYVIVIYLIYFHWSSKEKNKSHCLLSFCLKCYCSNFFFCDKLLTRKFLIFHFIGPTLATFFYVIHSHLSLLLIRIRTQQIPGLEVLITCQIVVVEVVQTAMGVVALVGLPISAVMVWECCNSIY
jgi:hypothetical protein